MFLKKGQRTVSSTELYKKNSESMQRRCIIFIVVFLIYSFYSTEVDISRNNQKPDGSASSSCWILTKCNPLRRSFPSSNDTASARCTSFNRDIKNCVDISASTTSSLRRRSHLKLETSAPANHVAKAYCRSFQYKIKNMW